MKNNVVFTIEQVDNKLIISAESLEFEQPEQLDLSKYKVLDNHTDTDKPMDAEQIGGWLFRNVGISIAGRNRVVGFINDLVQYEVNKAKR